MGCPMRVSVLKTSPHRAVCGIGGRFYNVTGAIAGMQVELCRFHVRALEKLGLEVSDVTPLEALRFTAEKARSAGLRTQPKPGEPGYQAPA